MNNKRWSLLIACLFSCIFSYGMKAPTASSSTEAATPSIHQAILDAITAYDGPKTYVSREQGPQVADVPASVKEKCDAAIKYIIKHKRGINLKNRLGQTPLHVVLSPTWAQAQTYPQTYYAHYNQTVRQRIAECLINQGASLRETDEQGNTPLHITAAEGWPVVVNLILSSGDPHGKCAVQNAHGQTPLHLATTSEVAELLIPHTQLDAQDKNGQTPLHAAVAHNCIPICEAIFKATDAASRPALCNAPDSNGKSPLHVAIEHKAFAAAGWLLEHSADPVVTDAEGKTPIDSLLTRYSFLQHPNTQAAKVFLAHCPTIEPLIREKSQGTPLIEELDELRAEKLTRQISRGIIPALRGHDHVCQRANREAKEYSAQKTPIIRRFIQAAAAVPLLCWAAAATLPLYRLPVRAIAPPTWAGNLFNVGIIVSSMALVASCQPHVQSIIRWGHQKFNRCARANNRICRQHVMQQFESIKDQLDATAFAEYIASVHFRTPATTKLAQQLSANV